MFREAMHIVYDTGASKMRHLTKHAADIVAALTPPPRVEGGEVSTQSQASKPSLLRPVAHVVPAITGGAAGIYLWRTHRVLGGISGLVVGNSLLDLYKGDHKDKVAAYCWLGAVAAGVVGTKILQRSPVKGYLLGAAAGAAATAFVADSPAHDALQSLKAKLK